LQQYDDFKKNTGERRKSEALFNNGHLKVAMLFHAKLKSYLERAACALQWLKRTEATDARDC
jgi:hypothetical protein